METQTDTQQLMVMVQEVVVGLQQGFAEIKTQNLEIKNQNALLAQELADVKQRVISIEANVIIVREMVISEFQGIAKDTRESIQAIATKVTDDLVKQEILAYAETCQSTEPSPERTEARKAKVQAGKIFKELKPDATKGEVTAFGNWLGKQMSQLFSIKFSGWYHNHLEELIESMALFYVCERQQTGRLY